MKKTYRLLLLFILLAIVQLYVPAKMILDREEVLTSGVEYKFKTIPVDPNDPFRGKYVSLKFEAATYQDQTDKSWVIGEDVYVILTRDSKGFAKIESLSRGIPQHEGDYFKSMIRYIDTKKSIDLKFPFNRFYMEEKKAKMAEKVYRKSQLNTDKETYALVILKNGESVLKDVLIDGKSIKDIVSKDN